jgi:hypothetical protein
MLKDWQEQARQDVDDACYNQAKALRQAQHIIQQVSEVLEGAGGGANPRTTQYEPAV